MFEGCSCGGCCAALVIIPLVCIAMIACGLIYFTTNGAEPPLTDKFRPSQSEAVAFENQITTATNDARSTGRFTITFTERQVSSWMALEGERFAQDTDIGDFPFKNVQVALQDGEMIFYGELQLGNGVDFPVEIIIEPVVDRANHLDFEIKSVDFSGLKLPGALVEIVTDQLKEKMIKPLENIGADYVVDPLSLRVTDGYFTINGQILY